MNNDYPLQITIAKEVELEGVGLHTGNKSKISFRPAPANTGIRFFRSSELLLLAYEKGYFADYGKLKEDAIEASLYKLKYSGCAVGFGEISDYISRNVKE